MHTLRTESGTYTRSFVRLTGQIEQRDGYASDTTEEVELVTCDSCGALVLLGGFQLDSVTTHDVWHMQQNNR